MPPCIAWKHVPLCLPYHHHPLHPFLPEAILFSSLLLLRPTTMVLPFKKCRPAACVPIVLLLPVRIAKKSGFFKQFRVCVRLEAGKTINWCSRTLLYPNQNIIFRNIPVSPRKFAKYPSKLQCFLKMRICIFFLSQIVWESRFHDMFVCVKPHVDCAVAIGQEIFFIVRWEKLLMRVALLCLSPSLDSVFSSLPTHSHTLT